MQPDSTYPNVPAQVWPYVRVLVPRLTVRFLLEFGGAELYFAENPRLQSRIGRAVGVDLGRALTAELGGNQCVRVPLAKPWLAACLAHEGMGVAEIARTLHAADTTVRGWLRNARNTGTGADE